MTRSHNQLVLAFLAAHPARALSALLGPLEVLAVAAAALVRLRLDPRALLEAVDRFGFGSILHTAATASMIGLSFVVQFARPMARIGAEQSAVVLVGLVVVQELGPLLAGILTAASAGSGLASRLANMAVTGQLLAARVLALDLARLVVLPQVLALALIVPALALLFDACGLAATAWAASADFGMSPALTLEKVRQALPSQNFVGAQLKAVLFGLVAAAVALDVGLRTDPAGGAAAAGAATTSAAVRGIVALLLLDYPLSLLLMRGYP
jgi:phospholipid/cholesterol/gamma-HCH transport system permease protein